MATMNSASQAPRLLGISGSIRSGSYSTAILSSLKVALEGRIGLEVFSLRDLPPYNSDLEGELVPSIVLEMRERISAADGLVLCSPEYNHGVSGILKNAIDWASRPAFQSCLRGKPVLIVSSSPASTGGVRAQYQLREALASTLSRVVNRPEVIISNVNEKIVDGVLMDAPSMVFLLASVEDLVAEISLSA